jgi:uncharacterized protein YbaP (TraB family)
MLQKPAMKKFFYSFAALVLFCNTSSAQTSENHLLWRISGNGLSKPSYLFGTMHLTDKRLFHFGDSLYKALEQTEGFAAELDLNEALGEYFEKGMSDEEPAGLLKDNVDGDFLKQYKTALEKKFKKDIGKITMQDVKKAESAQRMLLLKSGEMNTFMDAYLFGLAEKQGKWVGGIEDMEDQMGITDSIDTEWRLISLVDDKYAERKQVDWMIQLYLKENLEAIDRSSQLWKGAKDVILINRNVKMAYRIDSLTKVRTNLFAVGAAHLPGDSGVVSLLRRKGFTVTPVISSARIDPAKYTYTEIKRPWVDVWGTDSLYTIQMPRSPKQLNAVAGRPAEMMFYYDPVNSAAYFTTGMIMDPSRPVKDSVFKNLSKYYQKSAVKFTEKDITSGSNPGKEFLVEMDEGMIRMQVFIPGSYVAMNMISAIKKDVLFSAKSNQYFSSFRPDTAMAGKLARAQAGGWRQSIHERDGFTVKTPSKFKRTEQKTSAEEDAWIQTVYSATERSNGSYYAVQLHTTPPGYYAKEDSVYFNNIRENLLNNVNAKLISSRKFQFEGHPAYEMLLSAEYKEETYQHHLQIIARGNRRYTLQKTYDPKLDKGGDEQFFKSFHFIPASSNDWTASNPANGFTTFSPQKEFVIDSVDGEVIYSVHDSVAAASISVSKEVLSKYYWTDSEKSLFDSRIKTFVADGDSVIVQSNVRNGNSTGVDLLIYLHDSQLQKKMRLVLNGDTLYTLYGVLPVEVLNTTAYKRFFEDFRPLNDGAKSTFIGHKAQMLQDSLMTRDSAEFSKVLFALRGGTFKTEDIPWLQRAMLNTYLDYDTMSYYWENSSNGLIAEQLMELDSKGANVEFVRENYRKMTGDKLFLRMIMLSMLGRNKTQESYDLLKQLIKLPLPVRSYFDPISGLDDSLALSAHLFPDAFEAMTNRALIAQISSLAITLLDSGYIDLSMVKKVKPLLIRLGEQPLSLKNAELEDRSYDYTDIIQLLKRLNDTEANAVLRKLGKSTSITLNMDAWISLLENKQPVTSNDLLMVAKSFEYRTMLYSKLEQLKKQSLFPKAYLTQQMFGQGYLCWSIIENEASAEQIVFIKEKFATYNDVRGKFYLYKVILEEDSTQYLGIAGPFSSDQKELKVDNALTGVYWTEELDIKKIDEQFARFWEEMKKAEEESGGEEEEEE